MLEVEFTFSSKTFQKLVLLRKI